jgi:hypothetical protein
MIELLALFAELMLPGLGVPGLSVLMDLLKDEVLALMEMGMERLVGLRNMPGEAIEDLINYSSNYRKHQYLKNRIL